jgi:VIT1/CCC1 family predicted Fe2+/Mn2+ transporter
MPRSLKRVDESPPFYLFGDSIFYCESLNVKNKLEHSHKPEEIARRLRDDPELSYLRDWVYGGIDGAITTFAVVAGVVGAKLSFQVILILGAANILADGFSMGAANYLGTKSEEDERKFYKAYEEQQVEKLPDGEREEVRQIYLKKGFTGTVLEELVASVTADPKLWVDVMLQEEYGLPTIIRSPYRAAWNTFISFVICGLIPLLPFTLHLPHPFLLSTVMVAIVFFAIGSLKGRWSTQKWWLSGLITLAVGGVAATLAYGVGVLFHFFS